jgi:hypothetical protein
MAHNTIAGSDEESPLSFGELMTCIQATGVFEHGKRYLIIMCVTGTYMAFYEGYTHTDFGTKQNLERYFCTQ